MPIRNSEQGRISKQRAAEIAALAANFAADLGMSMQPEWLPAEFCPAFGKVMEMSAKK